MTLHKSLDDWFLGYQTRVVNGRRRDLFGRSKHPLKPGSALANLTAAARKHPEVMVKIPKRHSANSKGMRGIRNHLDYVSRNGEVVLETQDGEKLNGKKQVRSLLDDWKKLNIAEESHRREALNIVLSMPEGTPPQAVLNAAREFAAEQFDGHQYVFGLHHESELPGEPKHPHVHLCVLMRDENGRRLNPRKNDLFEWRVRFAEKLRDEGVQCAATRRQHRGKTQKAEQSQIRAIRNRGQTPYRHRQWAQELAAAVRNGQRPDHPFLQQALATRGVIAKEYGLIARELYKMGHKTEARMLKELQKQLAETGFTTKMQEQFDSLQPSFRRPEPVRPKPEADNSPER